jgi:cytochrome c-type biogenesis protein
VTLALELGPAGLAVSFAAGFVAFSSPCVLPLVPGYLSFVSGLGFDELGARPSRVAVATGAFVAGFMAMFVALGAGAAWFGGALLANRRPLEIASGAFMILAAAVIAGLRLPRVVLAERRLHAGGPGGPVTAVLTGVAFAAAWTPCIGPTLGAILTLSAAGQAPAEGAVLLAAFSLGLGLPFVVFGLAFTRALGLVRALRRHYRTVALASAAALATVGALLVTGDFVRWTAQLARYTGWQI